MKQHQKYEGVRPQNDNHQCFHSNDRPQGKILMCGRDCVETEGTIIGPFFFDVNIMVKTYLNVINEEIVPQMQMHFQFDVLGDVMLPDLWWSQDGATCYRHDGVTARLTALFGANGLLHLGGKLSGLLDLLTYRHVSSFFGDT